MQPCTATLPSPFYATCLNPCRTLLRWGGRSGRCVIAIILSPLEMGRQLIRRICDIWRRWCMHWRDQLFTHYKAVSEERAERIQKQCELFEQEMAQSGALHLEQRKKRMEGVRKKIISMQRELHKWEAMRAAGEVSTAVDQPLALLRERYQILDDRVAAVLSSGERRAWEEGGNEEPDIRASSTNREAVSSS